MKEKYYTPELEEIKIGLEYEVQQYEEQYGQMVLSNNYEKFVIDESDTFKIIANKIKDKTIRVKYLDDDDLNELFHKKEDDDHTLKLMKHKSFDDTHRIIILKSKTNIPVFEGIIKNKSELKVLIKQLSIWMIKT